MNTNIETRAITLVDIPLVKRLSENGVVLNSELALTRASHGSSHSALITSILFSRELYTLVSRVDDQHVIGQFRYRQDEPNAHIVYLAPQLDYELDDTAWLHILDAMTREAGKHGAHALVAEIDEDSPLFETMRLSNFAVYARQVIWRRDPLPKLDEYPIELTEETPGDHIGIMSLQCSTVPAMVQQVTAPHGDMRGLVYRKEGRIEGYIAVSEGKHGVYLMPYLHPDILSEAADVLDAAIGATDRGHKVPIYVGVRAYQNWLAGALLDIGFETWIHQAVMVRHIAAGVRHASFERVGLHGSPVSPPASWIVLDAHKQERIVV